MPDSNFDLLYQKYVISAAWDLPFQNCDISVEEPVKGWWGISKALLTVGTGLGPGRELCVVGSAKCCAFDVAIKVDFVIGEVVAVRSGRADALTVVSLEHVWNGTHWANVDINIFPVARSWNRCDQNDNFFRWLRHLKMSFYYPTSHE